MAPQAASARRQRWRSLTFVSRHATAAGTAGVLVMLFFGGRPAWGDGSPAVATPEPPPTSAQVARPANMTAPLSTPSAASSSAPVTPPAAPANGFERRHRFGAQLGGSGVLQGIYRFRAIGPLHLEVGGAGVDHAANVSAGLIVGMPVAGRWFPYVGAGGAAMWSFGSHAAGGCPPSAAACPTVDSSKTLTLLHARAGVGLALGRAQRQLLSVDVGGWWGHWSKVETGAGPRVESSGRTLMPMVGLSWLFVL